MKLLILALATFSTGAFAQFTTPGIPTNGLSLNCRTTGDVQFTDFDKDGRLFISASINTNNVLNDVSFKINKTSNFSDSYKSDLKDLSVFEVQMGDRSVKMFDTYTDDIYSFSITQFPMNFNELGNRIDTFSANVGVVDQAGINGMAKNFELRCVVKAK